MSITKSSRHSKIIGNLGEALVADLLSRSGWETLLVDHVGIDLIAFKCQTGKRKRIGVTVKSRTRTHGKEGDSVNIFYKRKGKCDRKKLHDACEDFACEPWLAIYVETEDKADLYLTSLEHYDKKYRGRAGKALNDWKMTPKHRKLYDHDPKVHHLHLEVEPHHWNMSFR